MAYARHNASANIHGDTTAQSKSALANAGGVHKLSNNTLPTMLQDAVEIG